MAKIALKIVFKLKRFLHKIIGGMDGLAGEQERPMAVLERSKLLERSELPLTSDYGTHQTVKARIRANMALIRHSRPDSGLGIQVKVLKKVSSWTLFARKRLELSQRFYMERVLI